MLFFVILEQQKKLFSINIVSVNKCQFIVMLAALQQPVLDLLRDVRRLLVQLVNSVPVVPSP